MGGFYSFAARRALRPIKHFAYSSPVTVAAISAINLKALLFGLVLLYLLICVDYF
jgi:hypothetical protein